MCNDRDPLWFNGKKRLLMKEKYKYTQHTNIFVKLANLLIGSIVWNFSRTPLNPQKKNTIVEWLVSCKIRKNFKKLHVFTENILRQ